VETARGGDGKIVWYEFMCICVSCECVGETVSNACASILVHEGYIR